MYPNGRKLQDTGYVTLFLKDSGRFAAWLTFDPPSLKSHQKPTRFSPANVRAHVKFSVVDARNDHTNSKVAVDNLSILSLT